MHRFRPLLAFFVAVLVFCFAALLLAQSQTTSSEKSGTVSSDNQKPQIPGENGVSPPVCTYMPNPPYTKEARAAKFEGTVLAEGVFGLDGKITSVRILKSPGLGLDESIIKTLKKWRCKPGRDHDGKPVTTILPFQFGFRLNAS